MTVLAEWSFNSPTPDVADVVQSGSASSVTFENVSAFGFGNGWDANVPDGTVAIANASLEADYTSNPNTHGAMLLSYTPTSEVVMSSINLSAWRGGSSGIRGFAVLAKAAAALPTFVLGDEIHRVSNVTTFRLDPTTYTIPFTATVPAGQTLWLRIPIWTPFINASLEFQYVTLEGTVQTQDTYFYWDGVQERPATITVWDGASELPMDSLEIL